MHSEWGLDERRVTALLSFSPSVMTWRAIFLIVCAVAELNAQTPSALTTLYSFSGGADGSQPYAGLVRGYGGELYGTTQYGGTGFNQLGNGTVFSLRPPS